jgi:hypothetical protein
MIQVVDPADGQRWRHGDRYQEQKQASPDMIDDMAVL